MKRNNYSISLIGCVCCFFFLASFSFESNAYPAPSDYFDTVQKVFIGYYQRPAAPGGLIYWASRLDANGGNLTDIIEAFANSAESRALYGPINNSNISSVVTSIFWALFNRAPGQAGLNYYVNGFNSGQFTAATIMLNVLNGAQNQDLQSVNNKVTASSSFTRTIDPNLDGANFQATYSGNTDAQKARDFLSTVNSNPGTIPTQADVTLFIKNNIADPGDPINYPVCTPLDQCHVAGTYDPTLGFCSNPPVADGTPCNNGNSCTWNDTCQAGVCVGSDQRTTVEIWETLQRLVWSKPDGSVELYYDAACTPWSGNWSQGDDNYCGPVAGMNLLDWYTGTTPYDNYYQLGSEMHTNNWISWMEALKSCADFCPFYLCQEPNCYAACSDACDTVWSNGFFDMGTHPDYMENTLRKYSPLGNSVGYLLYRRQGNPGLETLEWLLAQGYPIVVLIWNGETLHLHWTLVTGTYDQNGTVMIRFANYSDQTWDWFLHQWSFAGLNWPVPDILSHFGIKPFVWMYYERTTILTTYYEGGLWIGNSIISADGRFRLILQWDSNLCLRKIENDEPLWCSMTNGTGAEVMWMQTNGNLVLRNSANAVVWSSNSYVGPGGTYYLAIQNDGNLVIYNAANNNAIWATDTCCH